MVGELRRPHRHGAGSRGEEPGRGTGGGQRASDAGSYTFERIGQRRVYALRPGSLRDLAAPLSRIADKSAAEVVEDLKAGEGGDILVLSSASVIKALLTADKVDRLALTVFPVFLGGGPRFFDDGLPAGAVDARRPGGGRARHTGPRLRRVR
ncbi:dihydrofolate reductase family protein [Streptomyces similanensis]|uniref:Bacterial bifunctional deaminase-reductase C-terminal domain-containing protein n=1 Tax=Streptomyces similanensis TaxID=1274988 RepID=A0ABP9KBW5_9ACTN